MTRKKRPAKPTINPLVAMAPLSNGEVERIMLHYYMALGSLSSGRGTERDLFTLLKVCELFYIMAASGRFEQNDDVLKAVTDVAHGVRRGAARVDAGNNAGLDGPTYQTLKEILPQVEEVLRNTSVIMLKRWLATQEQSIRAGVFACLQGVYRPHAVVQTTKDAWCVA